MGFMDHLKNTLNEDYNRSITENGAVGYRTTGKKLLDLNFQVSSLRSRSEQEVQDKFTDAFYEDRLLAIKWLFYAGDVRGGLGERRLFRIGIQYLAENHPELAKAVLEFIPFYSRWDNLFGLLDTSLCEDVIQIIKRQLEEDQQNLSRQASISLLAKWLPSANASSKETKRLAHIIIAKLDISEKQYRKMLSSLRAYLKVVEVSMSKKEWSQIDYAAVPSRANVIYNRAFLRNDETRRRDYLERLRKGETKIHAGVLFPHDIVHEYYRKNTGWGTYRLNELDATLEELWKALPEYGMNSENTICVADGSGSMGRIVGGGSQVTCLEVANALAIYFAERSSGQFQNTYITFSEHPQIVDLSTARNLREKLEIAHRHNEVANTNIEAVFQLILRTAVNQKMKQEELPKNILILSDMEFDGCACCYSEDKRQTKKPTKRLFEILAEQYREQGYELPRLVFWNICSRTNTIPIKENHLGVALVSGFSPNIMKMVLSNSTDPLAALLEQLQAERYDPVEQAVKGLIEGKELSGMKEIDV